MKLASVNTQDSISINTLIGPGSFVQGNISIAGFIRIDGDVDGDIETTGRVIIGEKARIKGTIRALTIIVGGIVQGDIIAPENVHILSSALVIGSILTKKIIIEEKVVYSGACFAINDTSKFEAALATYNNKQAFQESIDQQDRGWNQ